MCLQRSICWSSSDSAVSKLRQVGLWGKRVDLTGSSDDSKRCCEAVAAVVKQRLKVVLSTANLLHKCSTRACCLEMFVFVKVTCLQLAWQLEDG